MSRQLREFRRGLRELKAAPKIEPCLPSPAAKPPAGPGWLHEIKHDGFRIMIRRDAAGIRILTRNGYDWTARFALMLMAAGPERSRLRDDCLAASVADCARAETLIAPAKRREAALQN